MKILVVCYSYTSHARTLGQFLAVEMQSIAEVTYVEIEPQQTSCYWGWLARSFLPGWSVAIKPTIADWAAFDLVFLGFPKWTLGCPPLNSYLNSIQNVHGKAVALFMSCGGFDQERYLRGMVRQLTKSGARVIAAQWFRRHQIIQNAFAEAMQQFYREALRVVSRGSGDLDLET